MNMKELSPEHKAQIDAMSNHDLFRLWRFAPIGDARLQGARGDYVKARLQSIPAAERSKISKDIGL